MTLPGRWPRRSTLLAVSALVSVGLIAGAIPLVWGDPASIAPGTSAPPQTWSEGTASWSNASGSTFNATYSYSSYSGERLTVTATNTSSTVVEIETVITSSSQASASGCAPSCIAPTSQYQDTSETSVMETYFENFTSAAQVRWNGTNLSALGVLNVSEQLRGQSLSALNASSLTMTPVAGRVVGTSTGHNAYSFSPSFGLVPWTIPTNGTWNGTGVFDQTSSAQSNFTVSGVFTNLTGILGWQGPGGLVRPLLSHPLDGSGNTSSSPPYPSPPPILYGSEDYGGFLTFCVPQNTPSSGGNGSSGGYDPWENTSCSLSSTGTEYATGGGWFGAGSYNGTSGPSVLEFTGPYVPGPALSAILPGSDLFGGAAAHWGALVVLEGYFGLPGLGVPGPEGGFGGAPPGPPPRGSDPGPIARADPIAPMVSPAHPSMMMMFGIGPLLLVALAALAGAIGMAFWMRRRPPVPPTG
jgi:hypothetical protein